MSLHRWTFALATIAAVLGAGHLTLALLAYPAWTIDALWFVGTGLAVVIAAAVNFVALSGAGRNGQTLAIIVNFVMAGFFAAAWLVLPAPQVIVGSLVFFALAICGLAKHSKSQRSNQPG